MESRYQSELKKAREYFLGLRLPETYAILRRFYDRLPFQQEPEHAEYMGIFVRVLYELGKEDDLKFYKIELEKIYRRAPTPEVGYQLALTYLSEDRVQVRIARDMLEELQRASTDIDLLAKIKMSLAACHDTLDQDVAACTLIIDSIKEPSDPYLKDLLTIWKAKNLRDLGKLQAAEALLGKLLARVSPSFNWYAYFSAKVVLAGVYLKQKEFEKLLGVVSEVRAYCEKNPLRTVQRQIDYLANQISGENRHASVSLRKKEGLNVLQFEGKSISVSGDLPWEKLLLLLINRELAPKEKIIEHLYHRPYLGEGDDRLIYSHIHSVKKNLRKLGVPGHPITKERAGYRWATDLQVVEGEMQ